MSVETVVQRTFRLLPGSLRERIAGGWANESATQHQVLKEFDNAPAFLLQHATDVNIKQVATGRQDGYYLYKLENGQVNLHFSPLGIIQREDLLDEDNIPSFGFSGCITFDPIATESSSQAPLSMLPLSIKYKGRQVHLIDLFPQMGMTLQATGFLDEKVFHNSTLYLKHRVSNEKFVVKFMPEAI